MVDYSKGLIYKLCCNDTNIKDIYVGSTTNFIRRKCNHKSACNNVNKKSYNYYVYKFIRDNGGWCNWSMVLVREYNATNKMKLARKERKYIEKLGATLNGCIPTRTAKQYYETNKQVMNERKKEYYKVNKDVILNRNKAYRETNKQVISEQKKEYYKDNNEEIKRKHNERIECDCGCIISRSNLAIHKKSQKHKDLMNEQ